MGRCCSGTASARVTDECSQMSILQMQSAERAARHDRSASVLPCPVYGAVYPGKAAPDDKDACVKGKNEEDSAQLRPSLDISLSHPGRTAVDVGRTYIKGRDQSGHDIYKGDDCPDGGDVDGRSVEEGESAAEKGDNKIEAAR